MERDFLRYVRMPRIPVKERHASFFIFLCFFILAGYVSVMAFPSSNIKTPFNFIIAYSIIVAVTFGVFAFMKDAYSFVRRDIERDRGVSSSRTFLYWRSDKAYAVYMLITLVTAVIAAVWITLCRGEFAATSSSFFLSHDLGKTVKTAVALVLEQETLKTAVERLDNKELGDYILVTIAERSEGKYRSAVTNLEFLAALVVACYMLADILGWWKGERKTFKVLVFVDFAVICVHGLSLGVVHGVVAPSGLTGFNPMMIQSFCGGLMGMTLLIQCAVFGYVISHPPVEEIVPIPAAAA